jgi:hypothetical protein
MLVVILLATKFLSPSMQGLFFSFMSFGVLVQLGDFGLSYAVMQKASYLAQASNGSLHWFETRVRRTAFFVAALSTAVAGILGFLSFSSWDMTPQLEGISWKAAWGLGLAGLFAGQCTSPVLSFIEGSGKVVAAWRLRMLQEWIGGIAFTVALVLGWGLYSISFYWVGRSLVSFPLLFQPLYKSDTPHYSGSPLTFRWRDEMWPFQWRIGLSSLSGFLIFRATTIVVLSEQGLVVAGQYGFALAAMNMMLAVTTSWPNSQAAHLGQLLSNGRSLAATVEAERTLRDSTLLAVVSAILVWVLFSLAASADLDISRRMTDLWTLGVIFSTGVIHHVVASQAVLLRAQVREPLLAISVIGGIVNISAAFIAAHFGTSLEIALSGLTCALVGLGVTTRLFLIQRKDWMDREVCR